jgi:hypothetical protein
VSCREEGVEVVLVDDEVVPLSARMRWAEMG